MRTRLFCPRKGVHARENYQLEVDAGIKTPFAGQKKTVCSTVALVDGSSAEYNK